MSENMRTQKGIHAHCERRNEIIVDDTKISKAYQGMPATFCIGSDSYATEVREVRRNKAGKVTGVKIQGGSSWWKVVVSGNCTSAFWANDHYNEHFVEMGITTTPDGGMVRFHDCRIESPHSSGALVLGKAVTYHDPSF
jgi:hypothetical protein